MTTLLDLDKLKQIQEIALQFPHQRFNMHGNRVIGRSADPVVNLEYIKIWKEMLGPELWDYLEENTYPYDGEIMNICGNYYVEGAYFGLHFDGTNGYNHERDKDLVAYTNLIVLDKSEDLEGGLLVLADLSALAEYIDPKMKFTETPLEVIDPVVGEIVKWNAKTLHGVTQVKKGHRFSLGVGKMGNENG